METWGILAVSLFAPFIVLILPIWIIAHYVTQARSKRGLSSEDERMLAELWDSARRMEDRINSLERILDNDTSSWRRKRHEQY